MDISKAIDKAAGAEREKVPTAGRLANYAVMNDDGWSKIGQASPVMDGPVAATPEAKQWDGWGTALKPAIEPIILARKPLDGTVAANVLEHGTGGLNIDASRVGTTGARNNGRKKDSDIYGDFGACARVDYNKGRFPANVCWTKTPLRNGQQSGITRSTVGVNPPAW